ncbi:hypothetical protein C0J52_22317 [Blattella germanica]|nr:hypothetical protein C0J52_22317 [Blattella germanica]
MHISCDKNFDMVVQQFSNEERYQHFTKTTPSRVSFLPTSTFRRQVRRHRTTIIC